MLGEPSLKESVAFRSDGVITSSKKLNRAQPCPHTHHLWRCPFSLRMDAHEQNIRQYVIAQSQYPAQYLYVRTIERRFITAEKALEDQIIFKPSAPRAPA